MPITELLERNAKLYGDDVALVEVNPDVTEVRRITWKEYERIEPSHEDEEASPEEVLSILLGGTDD